MERPSAQAESRARAAEELIASKTSISATLEATVESAELYMQALKLSDTPSDRKRLDAKCKLLIIRAEQLKRTQDGRPRAHAPSEPPMSTRKLTTRENIIVLEGSKLNGFIFKPWDKPPPADEFILRIGEDSFVDSPSLALSDEHEESFGGWRRPTEALRLLTTGKDITPSLLVPTMKRFGEKVDLVQDLTSDCSVVASLCAGSARAERGHPKISGSVIWPYDYDNNVVLLSPNGRYVFRFYFNGCWRKVDIDDLLPTSTNARVLHVVDRSHPGLLWPALLEKAYLKVRGGYDFPGSNSGTDVAVLTGWIPQQVFLHDHNVEPDQLWNELYGSFNRGDNMLTLGTGKLSRREQKHLGLAAEHDYAVLDMQERGTMREVLIKNPWADGEIWKGATRRKPHPNHEYPELPRATDCDEMVPGTFWMDFNSVFQHYENLYVNWNPALFSHRADRHFSWHLPHQRAASSLVDEHPQFVVRADATGEVWLLLNRHFRTGDYTHANNGKNGYISLYLIDSTGTRVLSTNDATIKGPFVDSPNTLLRFDAAKGELYTVVIVQQDLPAGKHNYTASVFSNCPAAIDEAAPRYPHRQSLSAAWTRSTSGGSSDSPNYLTNPQFALTLSSQQRVAFLLRVADDEQDLCLKTNIHVKALIAYSDGRRISRLRSRDIAAHSGDYRRGHAIVEATLSRGSYTIICSTFDKDQLAGFSLGFCSTTSDCTMTKLPAEDSGRLLIVSSPASFETGTDRLLAPLSTNKSTKTIIIARQTPRLANSSLFKLSLEEGQGPYKKTLATSSLDEEDFQSISTGLRLEDMILPPSDRIVGLGGLWLVLERLPQGSNGGHAVEQVQVELLADESITVGSWGVGEG